MENKVTLTKELLNKFYSRLTKVYIPKGKHDGGFPEVVIWKDGDVDDYVKIYKKPNVSDLKKIISKYSDAEKLQLRVWDDEHNGYYTADNLIDHSLTIYTNN